MEKTGEMSSAEEFGYWVQQMKSDVAELRMLFEEFADGCRKLQTLVNEEAKHEMDVA